MSPARPKPEEILRHEGPSDDDEVYVNFHDDDEEGFVTPPRETSVVEKPGRQPRPALGKGKRSLEDMMAAQPNEAAQCVYALQRIAALEDQIAKVIKLCTPEAKALMFKQRARLSWYDQ